jgi:hypothetical protein
MSYEYNSKQIMLNTNNIDIICKHINIINNIYPDKKIYIFLDIDDVVILDNIFNEDILKIFELTDNVLFLTARNPNKYRFLTLRQLNRFLNINIDNILFSPWDEYTGKSTKGNIMLKYLENNNLLDSNIHIIFVDDLFCNIINVLNTLQKIKTNDITYMMFQYK